MEQKIRDLLKFIYNNFGPLVVFYITKHFWDLKPAIAISVIFSILDLSFRAYRKNPISAILKFSVVMTILFGVVDLYSKESFLFKYEAVVAEAFMQCFSSRSWEVGSSSHFCKREALFRLETPK